MKKTIQIILLIFGLTMVGAAYLIKGASPSVFRREISSVTVSAPVPCEYIESVPHKFNSIKLMPVGCRLYFARPDGGTP